MTSPAVPDIIILKSPVTLIGADPSTNFVYAVESLNSDLIEKINSINTDNTIKDRIKAIKDNGGRLRFKRIANEIFDGNLDLIDGYMCVILSEMLLGFVSGEGGSCAELSEYVIHIDPLEEDEEFYTYKIRNLLQSIALGMPSATECDWAGRLHIYLDIIDKHGDTLSFSPFNPRELRTYVFQNTRFETSDDTKCRCGKIYAGPYELQIDLNLQICLV